MSQAKNTVFPKDFGGRLRWFRNQRGISQGDLGKTVERSPTSISEWEKGISQPTLEQIAAMAEVLKVSPGRLAYGDPFIARDAEQAPYVKLGDQRTGASEAPGTPTGPMINPRHQPVSNPTAQDCVDYFERYVRLAEHLPGYIGHTWIELQRHFPVSELEKQIEPTKEFPENVT
jgi:transcriptional regulator with XRE-family HTH domain